MGVDVSVGLSEVVRDWVGEVVWVGDWLGVPVTNRPLWGWPKAGGGNVSYLRLRQSSANRERGCDTVAEE